MKIKMTKEESERRQAEHCGLSVAEYRRPE